MYSCHWTNDSEFVLTFGQLHSNTLNHLCLKCDVKKERETKPMRKDCKTIFKLNISKSRDRLI